MGQLLNSFRLHFRRPVSKMETQTFTTALLYIGIFAGIPLAVIGVLFSLILKLVDPDAMLILAIFTAIFVAMWIFVPRERPERLRRAAEAREPTVRRSVPSPKALDTLTGGAKKRKARSKRSLFEQDEKHEPFVNAVEKSTRHPAAQPQVRRKAQSKARKKKKR